MSLPIKRKIVLDVRRDSTAPLVVRVGDCESTALSALLVSGGVPVLPGGGACVATLFFKRPDSVLLALPMSLSDGRYEAILPEEATAFDGFAECEITVTQGVRRLTTAKFFVEVKKRLVENGADVFINGEEVAF